MFKWVVVFFCALSSISVLTGCPQVPDFPSSIGASYPSLERAAGVYATADGGFVVMGDRTRFPFFDFRQQVLLSKRDANGAREWTSHFTAPMIDTIPLSMTGKAVKETPDGDFIVAGELVFYMPNIKGGLDIGDPEDITGAVSWSGFLLCVDSTGREKWRRTYRDTDGVGGWVQDVAPTTDGGFALAYFDYRQNPGPRSWLRKTDPQGNPTHDFQAPANGRGDAVQALADGGSLMAGHYETPGALGAVFLLKADDAETVPWSRTYASLGATRSPSRLAVRELKDGSLLLAGIGYSPGTYFLLKTDANGNEIGRFVPTAALPYRLHSVAPTADGGCILGGDDQGQVGVAPCVIKIGPLGQVQWVTSLETLGTPATASTIVQPRGQDDYVAILTTRTPVDDPHPGSSAPAFDFNIEAFALTHEGTVLPWPAP